MGSIPLPALDIKPVQQPDLLEKYGQLAQLRNVNQEYQQRQALAPIQQQTAQIGLQQQQQALKNQQALTAAYKDWDGKSYDTLAHLALQNGASGEAIQALQQHALTIRKTASDIASADATTGSKNAETLGKQLDMAAGELSGVLQVPPEQQGQALIATATRLAQQTRPDGTPLLDQQHLQVAQQLAQQGPQAISTALPVFAKSLTAFSSQLEAAQKVAQTASENATAAEKNMNVARGGSTDIDKFESDYLKAKNLPDTPDNRLAAFKEYTKETKIQPAEVRAATYLQMPQAVADPNNPGNTIYVTRKDAIGQTAPNSASVKTVQANDKYFTSGKGGQQLTAFNTAIQHLDTLNTLATDLGNGNIQIFNKAAQKWAEQTGNPAPTNFEAAKNAMAGEVAAALKASGATDQEISKVDGTFNKAQSPMQLKGAIATYRTLLNSKAYNLKQQYKAAQQGQPNFGDTNSDPLGIR